MTEQSPEPVLSAEIYFAASTGAFYDLSFWTAGLPEDAVLIDGETHTAQLTAEASGLHRGGDAGGNPVAVEPPLPTTEELATQARRRRDAEVASWRWMIERHRDEVELGQNTTLTAAQFAALLVHVQALRDVPAQPDFPTSITWPEPPFELATENT